MGQPNAAKWSAARILYEVYGVDKRTIAAVTNTTPSAVERRAEIEGWGEPGLLLTLHTRLLTLVEAQFDRIQISDESIEKTARATAVVAKIVQDIFDRRDPFREGEAYDRNAVSEGVDWRTNFFAKVEDAARTEFAGS